MPWTVDFTTLRYAILLILLQFPALEFGMKGFTASAYYKPHLLLLKRKISSFVMGQQGCIVVVYLTRHPVTVRWFRQSAKRNLHKAEVEHMLPVDGEFNYTISNISSGIVRASVLYTDISHQDRFPMRYYTIFSLVDMPMQYYLETEVLSPVQVIIEDLNGVRWTVTPPPSLAYGYKQSITIRCTVISDMWTEGDELSLYRIEYKKNQKKETPIWAVRKDSSKGYVNAAYRVDSEYKILNGGYRQYNLSFHIKNATEEHEGMYVCTLERGNNRTYVSSYMKQGRLSTPPKVELMSCELNALEKADARLFLTLGSETCIRCRGYGYPPPEVAIYSERDLVRPSERIHIDKHVNVADGGLSEAVYTFRNPSLDDSGMYTCEARNDIGKVAEYKFDIVIKTPKRSRPPSEHRTVTSP